MSRNTGRYTFSQLILDIILGCVTLGIWWVWVIIREIFGLRK